MYCRSFGSKLPISAGWSQFTFAVQLSDARKKKG